MDCDVVDLPTELARRTDAAWSTYLDAKHRAEATENQSDGIAAGKAWMVWLELHMTADQKAYMKPSSADVVLFRRPA